MKIYNYGNDYAFQQKQKEEPVIPTQEQPQMPITLIEDTLEAHVENQVQKCGGSDVENEAKDNNAASDVELQKAEEKEAKKKKETGSKSQQR